jgi:phenylalanyl-tRNA synthetase beta chain
VYRSNQLGSGKKSMAFRLTFVPDDKSALSPETVDNLFRKIVESLKKNLSAELR